MAQWICSTDLSELYEARRICKNANVQDYGSRDSVYAYITREDLVRIPVAIFFFFFCPLITCGEESQIPEFGAA